MQPLLLVLTLLGVSPSSATVTNPGVRPASRTDALGLELDVAAPTDPARVERTLRLETASFGRAGRASAVGAGDLRVAGARAEIARSGFTEWFETVPAGVEHGWTIASAPDRTGADDELWIGVSFRGLAPQISEGGRSAALVDERGVQRLSYRALRAWDAAGRELEARMDVAGGEFGLRVDDEGARYPVTVDPLLGTADFFFHPMQAGARVIFASSAGDVNGDGYSDLLVAADLWDEGATLDAGKVWLFRGSANGLISAPWWETTGPVAGGQQSATLGRTVATLGDIDADGYDDFAIGTPYWDGAAGMDTGVIFVFRGGPVSPTLHWTIEGSAPFTHLQGPERYIGDLNGDGRDDLAGVVQVNGAPERVDVFLGSASPTPPAPVWTVNEALLGFPVGSHTAFEAGAAGDVDGDGYDDLLVGASQVFGEHGRAMLFRGGPTGPSSTTPTWTASPPGVPVPGSYGLHVGSAGDIDANGYPDVYVAAFKHPGDFTGYVFVYMADPNAHGSQLLPTGPSLSLPGAGPNSRFGIGCDTAGDFDGDGYADLAVGMPPNTSLPGTGLVFRGGPGGLSPASTWQGTGQENGEQYGSRMGTAGDVNGDGRSDVFVTSIGYSAGGMFANEGAVYVHHGRPNDTVVGAVDVGAATWSGPPTSAFGAAVATGDVNGDGLQDLLVGSPDESNGESQEGRVYLFLADEVTGFSNVPSWTFQSNSVGAHLGASVAICGDVDNDGFDDVLVGAPSWTNGQNEEGRVWLFRGTASGDLGQTPAWTRESDGVNERFGASLAGAGDCNADGLGDVIVGSPGTYLGDLQRGHARVLYGRPGTFLDIAASTVLDGGQAGALFGAAVAGADDLNRDGYSDVLVGSPAWTQGQAQEGRAYAFLGGPTGVQTTANWVYEPNAAGARFGSSLATAGDVNVSGRANVVVGAPGYVNAPTLGGAAFLFLAQPGGIVLGPSPMAVLGATQSGARQGAAVAFAGDVNSDGLSDVLVGAPDFDASNGTIVDAGRVELYLGVSTGLLPVGWMREGTAMGGHLGSWCAGGADFDGDGFSDFAYGVPGDAGVLVNPGGSGSGAYFGSDQRRVDDTRAIGLLGYSEATSGFRIQGTSFNANFISSTIAGREDYRVEFEVKSLAATLDGSALQSSAPTDSGSVGGPVPPPIRSVVAGLTGGDAIQWRMRLALGNPLFPHTRWLQAQGNGKRGKKLGTAPDCNGNGVSDTTELLGNDCNNDLILDACQVPPICPTCTDCNGNGVPDNCELDFGNDCDFNQIPDDCQDDCDSDMTADACEIIANPSLDTNLDGVLDSCQTIVSVFCPGDGTGTACPCGNSSVPADAEGCLNSLGTGGRLRFSGVPRISADNFRLLGTRMPNSSALYFQGTIQQSAGAGVVFGDGKRCAAGAIIRLGTKSNAGGASQYPAPGDTSISVRGMVPLVGATRTYQCWYRNAAAFCTVSTFNLTNGLSATWVP